jgi:hypothetical protein
MRTLDIAWLGGLIEGEGSFNDSKGSPNIELQMTDRDTLRKAAGLFGVDEQAPWRHVKNGKAHYKTVYVCRLYGTRAVSWMMTLYPFLGERRQGRVAGILQRWRASDRAPRAPRGQRFMAFCHPDRVRCGKGLCNTCYMREWRARRKAA